MKRSKTSSVTGIIAASLALVVVAYLVLYRFVDPISTPARLLGPIIFQYLIIPMAVAAIVLGMISFSSRKKKLPAAAAGQTALDPNSPQSAPTQIVMVKPRNPGRTSLVTGIISFILGLVMAAYTFAFWVLRPLFGISYNHFGLIGFSINIGNPWTIINIFIFVVPFCVTALILGLVSMSSAKISGKSRALGIAGICLAALPAIIYLAYWLYEKITATSFDTFLSNL